MPRLPRQLQKQITTLTAKATTLVDTWLHIPDFRDGIAEWNAAWEAHFPSLQSTMNDLESMVDYIPRSPSMLQKERLDHNFKTLCHLHQLQQEMQIWAVTSVLQPDFCWKALTSAEREGHMLEGLLRTCLDEPHRTPMLRPSTCDITLASLEVDGGEGFLTLLKKYIPDGDTSVKEGGLKSYLFPGWMKEIIERCQQKGYSLAVQEYVIDRDNFLCSFLHNTVQSVTGTPRPPEVIVKSHGVKSTTLDWGVIPKRFKNTPNLNATQLYRMARGCEGCQRVEIDGARFGVCKECKDNMSREVFYCSRPCQVAHWSTHKIICGKQLTCDSAALRISTLYTEKAFAEAVFLLRRIGPARDGFTRSPALERQIQFLDGVPSTEYASFSPTGPRQIKITTFISRLIFRLAVETAACTGDAGCIAVLSHTLVRSFQDERRLFIPQFVAEFGDVAASAANAVQALLDGRTTFIGRTTDQWEAEFLTSEAGSQYAKFLHTPPTVPSFEATR
ncbi:hypothetical protein K438DRAFT_1776912 [Mycena galopus ATCC 62051]|nr:hypothetical protein K438DRAFT_1776912 [Mycena galopus ATCC 62051]